MSGYQSHYLRALLAKARYPEHAEELETMLRYLQEKEPDDPSKWRSILPAGMHARLRLIEASGRAHAA